MVTTADIFLPPVVPAAEHPKVTVELGSGLWSDDARRLESVLRLAPDGGCCAHRLLLPQDLTRTRFSQASWQCLLPQ